MSRWTIVTLSTILLLPMCLLAQTSKENPTLYDREIIYYPEIYVPREAEGSGLGGIVSVLAVVDRDGNVADVTRVTGPGFVCTNVNRADVTAMRSAAADAARLVKFAPIERGKPDISESWIRIEFPASVPSTQPIDGDRSTSKDEPVKARGMGPPSGRPKAAFRLGGPLLTEFVASINGPTRAANDAIRTPRFASPGFDVGGKKVSGGVLNLKALSLGVPKYPEAARMVKATGSLFVHVLIDSNGEVFSATPASGHPLLVPVTLSAACESKFAPAMSSGKPAMMYGVITYHFLL